MKKTIGLAVIAALPLSASISANADVGQSKTNVSHNVQQSGAVSAIDAMEMKAFAHCGPHSKACMKQVLDKDVAALEAVPQEAALIHSTLGV